METYLFKSVKPPQTPGLSETIFDKPPPLFPSLQQPRLPGSHGLRVLRVRVHFWAVISVPPPCRRTRYARYQIIEHFHSRLRPKLTPKLTCTHFTNGWNKFARKRVLDDNFPVIFWARAATGRQPAFWGVSQCGRSLLGSAIILISRRCAGGQCLCNAGHFRLLKREKTL